MDFWVVTLVDLYLLEGNKCRVEMHAVVGKNNVVSKILKEVHQLTFPEEEKFNLLYSEFGCNVPSIG